MQVSRLPDPENEQKQAADLTAACFVLFPIEGSAPYARTVAGDESLTTIDPPDCTHP